MSKIGTDVIGKMPTQTKMPKSLPVPDFSTRSNRMETMEWIDKNFKPLLEKIGKYDYRDDEIHVFDAESDLWIVVRFSRRYDHLDDQKKLLVLLGDSNTMRASDTYPEKITYVSVTADKLDKFANKLGKIIDVYKKEFTSFHQKVVERRKREEEIERQKDWMIKNFPLSKIKYVTTTSIYGEEGGFELTIDKAGENKYYLRLGTKYQSTLTADELKRFLELLKLWGIGK